ncbi:MAG: hypothetical protein QXP34_00505 [Candidatus Aenigmatarchaeota archaeon]
MTTNQNVNFILDVNLLVGFLFEKSKNSDKYEIEFEKEAKKLKEIKNIIEENFENTKVKYITTEDELERAYEILRSEKEYEKYLSKENLSKIRNYIYKRKSSGDTNGYSIKIDGISIYVIRKEKAEEYKRKYYQEKRKKHLETLVDRGDVELLDFSISYSSIRNGRNFYVLLTNDQRIIKEYGNIFRQCIKDNKFYITSPAILLEELNNKIKTSEASENKDYRLLREIFLNSFLYYVLESLERNKKR